MLTNDKAADLLKHFLVKAKRGKKKIGAAGAASELDSQGSWLPSPLFFPVFREHGPHRPTLPFPRLWLQPVELNKLTAGGLAIGSSQAGASYLLIYIPRRPARGPLLCTRPPPPGLRGLSEERGPLVLPTPKAGTCCSRPARPARPARQGGGGPAFLLPSLGQKEEERRRQQQQQPEEATTARPRERGGAGLRRPATLGGRRGGGSGAAGRDVPWHFLTGWPRAHGQTRTPSAPVARSLAGSRGPALRRPRSGGGALGGTRPGMS